MSKKYLIIVILLLAATGAVSGYFMWNKPKRDVSKEKGIEVTASQLVKEYQANESESNAGYLDKAIQVVGKVNDVKQNQEGKATIMLASDDAMTGVFCTLKEPADVKVGSTITLKGICSGMLSDVRLRDAVVVND